MNKMSAQWLDEYEDIRYMYLRGHISVTQVEERLSKLGFDKNEIAEHVDELILESLK